MKLPKIITKQDFINFCKGRKGSCKCCPLFKKGICLTGETYSSVKEWQDKSFQTFIRITRKEKLKKLLEQ